MTSNPQPSESDPQLLLALSPGPASDRLDARLTSLDTAAARWLRSADGLGHPGDHVGLLHYPDTAQTTVESARSDLAALADAISLPGSICLVGQEHTFIPGPSDRTRLWYFMRRRDDFTHDRYLQRYRQIHSSFGFRTPGIDAYTQFHVDPHESQRVATALACGVWDVDSVSILDMPTLEDFLAEIVHSSVGEEAIRDEERFVDRPRSWDYITRRIG